MRIDAPAAAPAARLPVIDAWRGAAILAMVVYHFSWDLRYFNFIVADVSGGPGWVLFARLIAGTFLFLVGFSLVLAARGGIVWRKFARRLAIVTAAAAAVTVATYVAFPDAYVFFGILHHIAMASVLGLAFIRMPIPLIVAISAACFVIPSVLAGGIFDMPALIWLGLGTIPVRSNDFVPIFPWFGVVLGGIVAARLALLPGLLRLRAMLARSPPRPLLLAGRHSLAIYLVHQPLLFGLTFLAAWAAPPDPPDLGAWFPAVCQSDCIAVGGEAGMCSRACACLMEKADTEGLGGGLFSGTLSDAETNRYYAQALACRSAAEQQLSPR